MNIKVLGTGCARCKQLFEETEAAISAAGVEANLCKIEKIDDIMKFGVIATPALIINDDIKCMGTVPNRDEIVTWLAAAAITDHMMQELRRPLKQLPKQGDNPEHSA